MWILAAVCLSSHSGHAFLPIRASTFRLVTESLPVSHAFSVVFALVEQV